MYICVYTQIYKHINIDIRLYIIHTYIHICIHIHTHIHICIYIYGGSCQNHGPVWVPDIRSRITCSADLVITDSRSLSSSPHSQIANVLLVERTRGDDELPQKKHVLAKGAAQPTHVGFLQSFSCLGQLAIPHGDEELITLVLIHLASNLEPAAYSFILIPVHLYISDFAWRCMSFKVCSRIVKLLLSGFAQLCSFSYRSKSGWNHPKHATGIYLPSEDSLPSDPMMRTFSALKPHNHENCGNAH